MINHIQNVLDCDPLLNVVLNLTVFAASSFPVPPQVFLRVYVKPVISCGVG